MGWKCVLLVRHLNKAVGVQSLAVLTRRISECLMALWILCLIGQRLINFVSSDLEGIKSPKGVRANINKCVGLQGRSQKVLLDDTVSESKNTLNSDCHFNI